MGGSGDAVGEGDGVIVAVLVANAGETVGRITVEVGSAAVGVQPPAARNATQAIAAALLSVEVVQMRLSSRMTLIAT